MAILTTWQVLGMSQDIQFLMPNTADWIKEKLWILVYFLGNSHLKEQDKMLLKLYAYIFYFFATKP